MATKDTFGLFEENLLREIEDFSQQLSRIEGITLFAEASKKKSY